MKIKLSVGALISAAVMGILSEIGSQIVTQKWDDIAERKGFPKVLMLGKHEDEPDEESDEETE